MKKSLQSLISICVILCIFFVLRYEEVVSQGSLVIANIIQNMSWYHGKNNDIERYNEAIFVLKKQQDALSAESLISPLLNTTNMRMKWDIYELYGDIEYSLGKPRDIIQTYYQKSLDVSPANLRVMKKLELLKSEPLSQSGQTTSTGDTTDSSSGSLSQSGWDLWEKKFQELQDISKNRGNFIDYHATPVWQNEKMIHDSLETLDAWIEHRNW